jgi:putative flippase GtrA
MLRFCAGSSPAALRTSDFQQLHRTHRQRIGHYTINKHMVFSKRKARPIHSPLCVACFGILFANSVVLSLLDGILGLPPHVAKLLTELILFILSFTVQSLVIFKPEGSHYDQKEVVKHA